MSFLDYIKGNRKGKNARQIELEAMYDPFLDEAIEGYDSVKGDHAARIAQMQRRVSIRAERKKFWRVLSITAVAAIAVVYVVSYFDIYKSSEVIEYVKSYSLMENTSETELLVYVSEDYVKQVQMSKTAISPSVEINNIEILEPLPEIDMYITEKDVERKKEIPHPQVVKTSATIVNLDEILTPDEPLNIYVPKEYIEKRKQHLTNDGVIIQNQAF